jgi:hypothetical protein
VLLSVDISYAEPDKIFLTSAIDNHIQKFARNKENG